MFLVHTPAGHAELVARAVVGACRGTGWASPLQPRLLDTLFRHLLGCEFDFETLAPSTPAEVAAALRSSEERSELIQLMCAVEILCNPVPVEMEASVARWAEALAVQERALLVLRNLARGQIAKSVQDFYRLNWIGDLDRRNPAFEALVRHGGEAAYALTVEPNAEVAARWAALSACPPGSIGRHLFAFYRARDFAFPGEVGAANEAVAHHDWIHLLADYATTPLGEIEVVSFMTTCTRAPGALLGLVGTLALFESGAIAQGLVTKSYPGEGLSKPGGVERMAEAISRGKACNTDLLLDVDFFSLASQPLESLQVRFGIPPKSERVRGLDPYGALKLPPPD